MQRDIPVHIQNIINQNNGLISSSEAKNFGRYTYYLVLDLVRKGVLSKLRNGLFIESSRLADTMIDLNQIIPAGVLCLYSAWSHYGLSTIIPGEFNVAVGKDRKVTVPEYPPVQLHRWSGATLVIGITSTIINGYSICIYDIEKSVCDAIKFRNKIGIDVMSEVLKNYLKKPSCNLSKLEQYARKLRIHSTLDKYLEIEL